MPKCKTLFSGILEIVFLAIHAFENGNSGILAYIFSYSFFHSAIKVFLLFSVVVTLT